jgi:hypothetical protein
MSTRTVRLDAETESTLAELQKLTGLSISDVLKRGVAAYRNEAVAQAARTPFEIYANLDLGRGGHARAPARQSRQALQTILRRKHGK